MDLRDFKHHVDKRLDSLETKLDIHLERLSKSEEAIAWLKGHVRIVTTVVVTAVMGAAASVASWLVERS